MPRNRSEEHSDIIPDERYPWVRFRLPYGKQPYFAFSRNVRRMMREGSDGFCDDCGKFVGSSLLTVSHINHRKDSKDYNNPQNARMLCDRCECEYHLSHVANSESIGLPRKKNIQTVWGHLSELPRSDVEELAKLYPAEIRAVCRLLNVFLTDLLERLD